MEIHLDSALVQAPSQAKAKQHRDSTVELAANNRGCLKSFLAAFLCHPIPIQQWMTALSHTISHLRMNWPLRHTRYYRLLGTL